MNLQGNNTTSLDCGGSDDYLVGRRRLWMFAGRRRARGFGVVVGSTPGEELFYITIEVMYIFTSPYMSTSLVGNFF
jgi:hypothetical protein